MDRCKVKWTHKGGLVKYSVKCSLLHPDGSRVQTRRFGTSRSNDCRWMWIGSVYDNLWSRDKVQTPGHVQYFLYVLHCSR